MGSIHVLDDAVINKIAAGEVVERPASVVKELVENALDAQARRITVEIEDGGLSRIVVRDNGKGMSPTDAQLALERHATSKITNADDLFAIHTMGFRGEALASIASVSQLTLATAEEGAKTGVRLTPDPDGQRDVRIEEWHGPRGTEISVVDLFHNVPARRKFLKSSSREAAAIVELIEGLSIAHPHVSFRVETGKKVSFEAPAVTDKPAGPGELFGEASLRGRARALWKEDDVNALVYAQGDSDYGHFEALVSPPGLEKATTKQMLSVVNHRLVRDKVLRYGILRGYHSHLLKGRYPIVLLNFLCDPALVDVNVHPAKAELRFQYPAEVQGLLSAGIRNAIRSAEWIAEPAGEGIAESTAEGIAEPTAGEVAPPRAPSAWTHTRHSDVQTSPPRAPQSGFSLERAPRARTSAPAPLLTPSETLVGNEAAPSAPEPSGDPIPWDELDYLGCVSRCFLLFSHGENLLALDQHAFHERILFEKLRSGDRDLRSSQPLLVPEALQLPSEDYAALSEQEETLTHMGFRASFLDHDCVEVSAVPRILEKRPLEDVIGELATLARRSDLGVIGKDDALSELAEHTLATLACHSAVRAGEELSQEEVRILIREADTVDFYANCPHGRRVLRWFSKSQIGAWFDR